MATKVVSGVKLTTAGLTQALEKALGKTVAPTDVNGFLNTLAHLGVCTKSAQVAAEGEAKKRGKPTNEFCFAGSVVELDLDKYIG
jgi:hypothetical protein